MIRREQSLFRWSMLLASGIGIALVYSGFVLAWVRTSGTGEGSFVEIGILLVLGMGLVFAGTYRRTTRITGHQLIYLLPIALYFLVSIFSAYAAGDSKILAWLLFGFIYFGLMMQVNISKSRIVGGFLLLGLIELLFFLAFNRDAIFSYSGGRGRVSFDNQAYTLTAYAIAGGAIAALYSLVFQGKDRLVSIAVLGLSIIIILGTGTRSVLVGLLAATGSLYLINNLSKRTLRRVMTYTLIASVCVFVLFFSVPTIQQRLENTFDLIISGVSTLSGDQGDFEQSAHGRRVSRQIGYYNFAESPLTGSGYATRQLDFPLLQAYQDLGIGFGLCFTLAFLVFPLLMALKALRLGLDQEKFLATLYILNTPRLFLHGTPYDWTHFAFIVPIYCVFLCRPQWGLITSRQRYYRLPKNRLEVINVPR